MAISSENTKVEEIAVALVREYLSRKGYKNTLGSLESEAIRTSESISSRSVLAKELGITKLLKENKAHPHPHRTIIEVLVQHFLTTPTSPPIFDSACKDANEEKDDGNPITCSSNIQPFIADDSTQRSPIRSVHSSIGEETIHFQDIEDQEIPSVIYHSSIDIYHSQGHPVDMSTAQKLREVLFGSATTHSFNEEWRVQGFVYSTVPLLQYGLIQYKGGPCGLLACVQSYILKYLLHSKFSAAIKFTDISVVQQQEALVTSLCDIIWKAGGNQHGVLVLKSCNRRTDIVSTKHYKPDNVTELLIVHEFNDYKQLKCFMTQNICEFIGRFGCILFLYSVILSKGVDCLRQEFDEPSNHMIGLHGYCSQEMINLLLTGCGTSNAFDGHLFIESDGNPLHKNRLNGINQQSDIGYLTLFEHYGSCKIGQNYKCPVYPIWVICSESHFTVLFSLENYNKQTSTKFDLHYYDGLGNFTEPVILTIETNYKEEFPFDVHSLVPPLNSCIQTKWKGARVTWNCEPIL